MKASILFLAFASVFLVGPSASAADDDVIIDRTVIHQGDVEPSAFKNEAFGIRPQFGVVTRQVGGSSDAHAVAGLIFDFNFLRRADTEHGKPYLGISFGGLYSHLGNAGSDFLGMNGAGGDNGSHMVELPLNVKVGYTFSDVFRVTAHGGVLPMYTSLPSLVVPIGTTQITDTWTWNSNVGADLEFGVGKNVGLLLRPDWAFASNDTFFTGTLGVDIPLT